MDGQVALVTGATDGIGLVTARELASRGARVIVVGRNDEKGASAVSRIVSVAPGSTVQFLRADLSSQSDIKDLAARVQGEFERLDILVNNAGATFTRRLESVDGHEMTFALNHMSYFSLTLRLMDLLVAGAPSRVVNVSSVMHRWGKLDFGNLQYQHSYSGTKAYSRSKLCNLLFTYELAARLAGTGVVANAVHPGIVRSNFANNNGRGTRVLFDVVKALSGISVESGAATSVHVATAPELAERSGLYFSKSRPTKSSRRSHDRQLQRRLWDVSAEISGINFGQDSAP
ncbi:MAG: SDR family oxidoreductase [Alphaproteobacteria bacterium]|nr:SDR family oxidoreductase [Alphaproteobacteria bacterium]